MVVGGRKVGGVIFGMRPLGNLEVDRILIDEQTFSSYEPYESTKVQQNSPPLNRL